MGSKKAKTVYYLITETEIYRTDELLNQINHWIHAFQVGRIIQVPNANQEALAEFEAHLEETYLESKKLIREDHDFLNSDF